MDDSMLSGCNSRLRGCMMTCRSDSPCQALERCGRNDRADDSLTSENVLASERRAACSVRLNSFFRRSQDRKEGGSLVRLCTLVSYSFSR